ncbi:fibrinogen alpha chain, partial [Lasius niger]
MPPFSLGLRDGVSQNTVPAAFRLSGRVLIFPLRFRHLKGDPCWFPPSCQSSSMVVWQFSGVEMLGAWLLIRSGVEALGAWLSVSTGVEALGAWLLISSGVEALGAWLLIGSGVEALGAWLSVSTGVEALGAWLTAGGLEASFSTLLPGIREAGRTIGRIRGIAGI